MVSLTIDLNVLIDFLTKRDHHKEAARIIDLCIRKKVKGCICSHEIATLAYFMYKEHRNRTKMRNIITQVLDIFTILSVNENVLRNALQSEMDDYEDAIIETCSLQNNIQFVVSRDLDDFKKSRVKTVSPIEFLALYSHLLQ